MSNWVLMGLSRRRPPMLTLRDEQSNMAFDERFVIGSPNLWAGSRSYRLFC